MITPRRASEGFKVSKMKTINKIGFNVEKSEGRSHCHVHPPLFIPIYFWTGCLAYEIKMSQEILGKNKITGIPWFTLLMWGTHKNCGKQKPQKSRLLGSTKGEENKINYKPR